MGPLEQQRQQQQSEQIQRRKSSILTPRKRDKILWFFGGSGKDKAKINNALNRSNSIDSRRRKSSTSLSNLKKPILTQLQHATIFRNIDSLYELSKNLEADLSKQGVHGGVGQVMLRYGAFFKMYVSFFMGAEQGMQLIHDLTRNNQRFKVRLHCGRGPRW